MQTISEDAWKENGKPVTAEEREQALGQKAGLILFSEQQYTLGSMNFVEHYLLRMGFHTIQVLPEGNDGAETKYIRSFLEAGLIVLTKIDGTSQPSIEGLMNDSRRILDCSRRVESEDFGAVLKEIKHWASELI